MNLLVDCHCFDYSTPQGINTYIRGLYSYLIPVAKEIHFFFAANDTDNLKKIFGEHPNVSFINIPIAGSLKRLTSVFGPIIKHYGIDYAHFQYVAPLHKSCKTIITLHDILFRDFPQYFPFSYRLTKDLLFKYSAKKADLLLTVSDYSQRQIAKHYKIDESQIHVTPNAIHDRFSEIEVQQARKFVKDKYGTDKYILYVSRLEPRKNQYGLIKAYIDSGLYKKGISLLIVGEESICDPRIKQILDVQDVDTTSHIKFINGAADNEIVYLYRGASLFVYPSEAEGFGIPPLEAAISLVPTICNNATAMGDFTFFRPRHINTSDCSELAALMTETISNPPSETELTDIKNMVMEKYSWEKIAIDYYELLSKLK